jgi:hypothetical protein
VEMWRKRLSEKPEGIYALVACVDDEVVGDLTLATHPTLWRQRRVGQIGMAVRDDWQGRGNLSYRFISDRSCSAASGGNIDKAARVVSSERSRAASALSLPTAPT